MNKALVVMKVEISTRFICRLKNIVEGFSDVLEVAIAWEIGPRVLLRDCQLFDVLKCCIYPETFPHCDRLAKILFGCACTTLVEAYYLVGMAFFIGQGRYKT